MYETLHRKPPLPRLRDHPKFHEFMRLFDAMRLSGVAMNYRELHRSIALIDPVIPYITVYTFFKKLGDPFVAAKEVARAELRGKLKKLADEELDRVAKNPRLLSSRDKIAFGLKANEEELREIKMVLDERHKQKQESFLDALLDQARYEDETLPILDKKAYGLLLPDPGDKNQP